MLQPIERRYMQMGGVRVSYLEHGTPQVGVPSMLILHGLIATAETFQRFAAQFPDRHIIVLDMPGSGHSDRPAEGIFDPSFTALADLVLQIAEVLDIHRPVLVGHSHGGAVSLQIAATQPESLHALVLISPAHPFSGHERWLVRFYLSQPGRIFAKTLPLLPRRLHLFAFRRMPGSRSRFGYQDLAPYLQTLKVPGTIPYLLRLLGTWGKSMVKLKREIERAPLTTPALLLWGDRDIVVPLSTAAPLLDHFQQAELITLKGIGHLPNEEAPEECASLIKTWLIWRGTKAKYTSQ